MAGEWIPVDCSLPTKPEVMELEELTGRPTHEIVGLLVSWWLWTSLHCQDGTVRMTVQRLSRVVGGDEEFWQAVEAVGWIAIDRDSSTVTVPGWEARFSKSAKQRRLEARWRADYESKNPGRRGYPDCADSRDGVPSEPPTVDRRTVRRTCVGQSDAPESPIEEIEERENKTKDRRGHQRKGHQRRGHQRRGHQKRGHQRRGHQRRGHQRRGHQRRGHQRRGHQRRGYQRRGQQRKKDSKEENIREEDIREEDKREDDIRK